MERKIEQYWPLVTSIILCVVLAVFWKQDLDVIFQGITSSSINISTAIIGFYLTIYTILSSIATRRMKFIKTSGTFPRLVYFLKAAVVWNFINVILILFTPIMEFFILVKFSNHFLFLKIFILSYSILLSIRFGHLFFDILVDPES